MIFKKDFDTNPKISIIILNWNGLKDTIECLESLKKVIYPNYEVIVVDNDSKGNDASVLEKRYKGYIKLIKNKENFGFAEGNNIGILEALKDKNCKYIFCLNNDTIIAPDILEKFLEIAEKEEFKKFGSFQPKMIWYYHRNLIDSTGLLYSKNSLGFNRGRFEPIENYNEMKEIFGCCGGAVLYRREAIEQLIKEDGEFFDKDFFVYYEDFDVAFRLQWRGWKSFYIPKAIVWHKSGKSTKKISKKSLYWRHRNNLYVIFKNLPNNFILKNFLLIFVVQLFSVFINFIKRGFWGFTILKAKIDAFKNYKKMKKKAVIIQKDKKKWKDIEKFLL